MKKRAEFLTFYDALIEESDIESTIATLKSGWLTRGIVTNEFEEKFKDLVGAKYAVAMNSATAALHTSLICAGVGEGDEVITTPLTFAASANTIIHTGATPVFVDVDPETKCIDPEKIREKITDRTKAIVPVHFAGHACDMDKIMKIAEEHNLFVSEDGAHATYTKYKDKMIGSIGNTTSFSFYYTKNLCTGEGGILTTDDENIANMAREVSLHGMTKNAWNRYGKKGSWKYDISYPGFKYNMTGLQAGLGLAQLDKLEGMQERREEIAKLYNEGFKGCEFVRIPTVKSYTRHAWHLYAIELEIQKLSIDRDEFIEELNEMNIGTSVHFIPVHLMGYYKERFSYKEGDFPVCEDYFNRTISIPFYPKMRDEDVKYVIDSVKYICDKYRK